MDERNGMKIGNILLKSPILSLQSRHVCSASLERLSTGGQPFSSLSSGTLQKLLMPVCTWSLCEEKDPLK